jgi:indolepyruvate ferredoxin oxidoreductase, alpha subunit
MTETLQVNGNEAVALAALSMDLDYFSHYPGSPVNFVEPAIRRYAQHFEKKVIFNDALNEHIATLAAGGAGFVGARSMVVMKHVGLNIAADPLTYLAYTGVKGAMVVVVGTDPGANASTGEADVHWYARMMNLPLLEPVTVTEIYRLCREAFVISEQYELPVLLFIPTRLAYDSEIISADIKSGTRPGTFEFIKDKNRYINVGLRNIRNHNRLIEKREAIAASAGQYIRSFGNEDADTAIITRGLTFTQAYESLHILGGMDRYHLINADMVYPLPAEALAGLLKNKKETVVIEDQDGFLEENLKMQLHNTLHCEISGKKYFPESGEIGYARVFDFLSERMGIETPPGAVADMEIVIPERLGTFCEGCPHRTVFFVLDKILKDIPGIIGGDIGCSSLPPFRADWLMCMNAGIGISQGIAQLPTQQVVFSTGGDGSFFHAGLLSLQSAVMNKINLIHLVLDNKSVAMTGHQESPTAKKDFDPKKLLKAIGVDRIYSIRATDIKKLEKSLRKEVGQTGVRVFWINGSCSRLPDKIRDLKVKYIHPEINSQRCGECRVCFDEFACPAILDNEGGLQIDLNACMRCGVCKKLCPNNSIKVSPWKTLAQFYNKEKPS